MSLIRNISIVLLSLSYLCIDFGYMYTEMSQSLNLNLYIGITSVALIILGGFYRIKQMKADFLGLIKMYFVVLLASILTLNVTSYVWISNLDIDQTEKIIDFVYKKNVEKAWVDINYSLVPALQHAFDQIDEDFGYYKMMHYIKSTLKCILYATIFSVLFAFVLKRSY